MEDYHVNVNLCKGTSVLLDKDGVATDDAQNAVIKVNHTPGGTQEHWGLMAVAGVEAGRLYDPLDPFANPRSGTFAFRKLTPTQYSLYESYLKTKDPIFYNQSNRI